MKEGSGLVACAVAFAMALMSTTPGHQSEFTTPTNYAAGSQQYSVAVGDFNGDGILDLATANFGGNAVSILLGESGGMFHAPVNYPVGPLPSSVAVGDFNGDGFLDLAVTNTDNFGSNGSVSILLGNGDGTFQSAMNYAAASGSPWFLTVADLNQDGKLDLAVANHDGDLAVYLGKGNGTFQPGVNYVGGQNPQSVAAGDFNGDGVPDLVMTNAEMPSGHRNDLPYNSASVFIGNGDGTFQAAVNYPVGAGPSGVAVADFNGDGKVDLAVANRMTSNISVLLGNGDGTFQTAVNTVASLSPVGLATGDVNGDGKADLVVCALAKNVVDVFLGNGDGTFHTPLTYAAGSQPRIVAIAGLSPGNALDLAVADAVGGIDVLLNRGGTLLTTTSSVNPSESGQPVTFVTTGTGSLPGSAKPTGTVTFKDGSTLLGTSAIVNGMASFTTSSLMVGTHTIIALYSGDGNFNPNVAPTLSQGVVQ
jgi:hypothetical protein